MVVMVAISISVVLTLAFTRAQTTNLQIHHNTKGREAARRAAETGAAVALRKIHSADWAGVGTSLSSTIGSVGSGETSYSVTMAPIDSSHINPLPDDAPLYLVLRSTGRWQSQTDVNDHVERTVELIVHLQPRVPGRTVSAGDSASADDTVPNPGDYDSIQQYSLFAKSGGKSLILDPEDRIDGNIWLYDALKLYGDPSWSSTVRDEFLTSVGEKFVSGNTISHPHPLAGQITFRSSPSSATTADLQKLHVPWTTTSQTPSVPTVDFSAWTTYQLYEGGPTYQAQAVGSYLESVVLRPTADNPLGIFYRAGSVQLDDNVTIQGTLVATGTIIITGEGVRLCAFNWMGASGQPLAINSALWPRLPAVVADEVAIDRDIRTAIEGAVVVRNSLNGAGGDFEYLSSLNLNITGTAVSTPTQQPWSTVQLQEPVNLSLISANGQYEIWLEDGATGNWHTIVGVDPVNRELTVIGEVRHASPVAYRIRPGRTHFIDIRGPVCGSTFNINRPDSWAYPSSSGWSSLRNRWDFDRTWNPSLKFVDWLADPTNFLTIGYLYPHIVYGLPLEPTFHLRNTTGIHYRWSPPLFRPFSGTGDAAAYSGYRWRIVSWRYLP